MEKEEKSLDERYDFVLKLIEEDLARPGMSANRLSSAIPGISSGQLSVLRKKKYTGDLEASILKIEQYYEIEKARIATFPDVKLIETPQVKKLKNFLKNTHISKDIGIVTGAAGIGKSETLKDYALRMNGAILIEANPCMTTKANFISVLSEALDVAGSRCESIAFNRIAGKASTLCSLIMIDNAELLTPRKSDNTTIYDLIRCFYDKGVGFVLCGNKELSEKVSERKNLPFYEQFTSRSTFLDLGDWFSDEIIKDIIYEITSVKLAEDQFEFLRNIANGQKGSLRIMNKILMKGIFLAQGKKMKLQLKHLEIASKHFRSALKLNIRKTVIKGGKVNVAAIEKKKVAPGRNHQSFRETPEAGLSQAVNQ